MYVEFLISIIRKQRIPKNNGSKLTKKPKRVFLALDSIARIENGLHLEKSGPNSPPLVACTLIKKKSLISLFFHFRSLFVDLWYLIVPGFNLTSQT